MTEIPTPNDSATQVRDSLLRAARTCFIASGYDKVSIRQIAEEAGVNMAMIRYYFGNKLGLFEAMITEFIEPIVARRNLVKNEPSKTVMADVFNDFYHNMNLTPGFPRFLFSLMSSDQSSEAKGVIFKLFGPVISLVAIPQHLFDDSSREEYLLVKMSIMSLLIFPYIIPAPMAELHGFKLDQDFYAQLAQHNIKLLENGLFGEKQ
ncbi:TetR/AcrR family transcriptional regulator [Shewanella youngdeokensis]|uniref:TetR/AcrR family transcriptional regulator n=1 Tax=Shewanella youngdeokensis TaxID=2999068 RepID=A0ABZ0K3T9_9GAMM|nr:TetR/AcrR family transcriptional regulator [Shewanella sp. DAU334]